MFAAMVRSNRRRLGLTQEELAAKVDLNVRTIRKLESGQITSPRPATVRLLADAFALTGADREGFYQTAAGEPAGPPAGPRAPAQLPADPTAFTGRDGELSCLDTWLAEQGSGQSAMVIVAVCGTAGVGKTALALHWAHRIAARFRDGQLYLNLRGYDPGQPMEPAEALVRLLASLGVSGSDIPTDTDELAVQYRTTTASRRLLIMLDNAGSVEQVRPLLPGTGSCAVVVTSRDSLAGLVALHGAHRLDLDLLPQAEAVMLLRRLIGPRVDSEAGSAATLADRCARLPLALRVAAELAVSRPRMSLSDLSAELDDQRQRLDLLNAGDDPRAAVKAVFSWSVRRLPRAAAELFPLLGVHPGPDLDAYAAAALGATSVDRARKSLELLASAHLVQRITETRYGMHDLLRAYAATQASLEPTGEQSRAALDRLFAYYLATAAAAMDQLHPAEAYARPRMPPATTPAPALDTPAAARRWLDSERPCLVAMSTTSAADGRQGQVMQLSTILYRYFDYGHNVDALAVHTRARDAARRLGDRPYELRALGHLALTQLRIGRHELAADLFREMLAMSQPGGQSPRALDRIRDVGDLASQARALNGLGMSIGWRGDYEPARALFERALALYRRAGSEIGQAHVLNNLGMADHRLGRYRSAIDHLKAALELSRKMGHSIGVTRALANLGDVHTSMGEVEQAAELQRRALAGYRESGDLGGEAWALNGLGESAYASGDASEAVAQHLEALTLATNTGSLDQQARAHTGLGHAYRALGEPFESRHHYERAVASYEELGHPDAEQVRQFLS